MTPTAAVTLNEAQRDCYQEIANVAMGQAADRLARLLDVYVELPIPRVNLIEATDLHMALQEARNDEGLSAVCQGFIGSGIAGEALLIFNDTSVQDLAGLLNYQGQRSPWTTEELLMDVSSLLTGACINGIGDQLGIHFNQGLPAIIGRGRNAEELLQSGPYPWHKTLAIEIHYSVEHMNIDCTLLLLFTEDSVPKLNKKIDFLLD